MSGSPSRKGGKKGGGKAATGAAAGAAAEAATEAKARGRTAAEAAGAGKEQEFQSEPDGGDERGEETGEERKSTAGGATGSESEGDSEDEEEDGGQEQNEVERLKRQIAEMKAKYKGEKRERKRVQRELRFPQVPTSAGVSSFSRPTLESGGGTSIYSGAASGGVGGGSLPSSSSAPRMPELVKMKPFNGEMDSDALDAWIRQLVIQTKYYSVSKQLESEESKVVFAAAHLDGAAADWYWSTAADSITTLKEFVDALNRRFKSSLDADVAAEKLHSLKQGAHPVTQYVGAVQQLLIRLPRMDMETRIRSFVRGLQPHLAQKLRELRPATVESAYEQAIRIEGSFVTSGGNGNKYAALSKLNNVEELDADAVEDEEKPVTLAVIKRMMEQKWKSETAGGAGTGGAGAGKASGPTVDIAKVECWGCGKKGHYKSDCRSSGKEKVKCYNCQKMGHYKNQCREKPKETTVAPGGQGN